MTDYSIDITRKEYPATASTSAHIAIKNLHLTLKQNEFVCLVGPSGCGKTTLMNIVAGIDQNYEGTINLGTLSQTDNKVAYVFQEPRLLPWRSVIQNIHLVLDDPNAPHNTKLIEELLELMEITHIRDHYPGQISLGMARRVALVRAFVVQPQILLMDEPFVSLDERTAQRIRQRLLETWQTQPHTILFVTHDIREAIYLADRIVFLSQAPSNVINEVKVTIPRHNRTDEHSIEAFRQSLKRIGSKTKNYSGATK
ncbi:MAG TPA: ABC transporter ATP-binding protein [Crenotrichaceae bacterium]|nr:ABC transporter ATP-binding protein [Crenotrichaceae bacterium]